MNSIVLDVRVGFLVPCVLVNVALFVHIPLK